MNWRLNGIEAGGDLVLIKTSQLLFCKSSSPGLHLNEKSREVCIKVRSPPGSFAFIGQVTGHTTIKIAYCTLQL